MRHKKGADPEGRGDEKEEGGVEEVGCYNQVILYEERIYFQ